MSDNVNHPKHYNSHPSGVEAIDVAQHYNFCIGNAIKYLWRAGLKGDAVEDLKKAVWYIQKEIDNREKGVYNEKSKEQNEGMAQERNWTQQSLQLDGLNQNSFTINGGAISAQPHYWSISSRKESGANGSPIIHYRSGPASYKWTGTGINFYNTLNKG